MLAEVPRQQELTATRPDGPFRISWSLGTNPELQSILGEAGACEQNRLDGVWFPDYEEPLNGWPELYVTLSAIASKTRTVRLGSLITDVLRRNPAVTAHGFASVSQVAPGRVVLGLGAGAGNSQVPFGISMEHSASKLDEGVRVIKALWEARGSKADFSGRYFSLRSAQPPLFPLSPIPVYLASYGPKMLDLTAELADGWVPECHSPKTFRWTLDEILGKMRRFGRSPDSFHACCASIFYPWEPDEKAYSRLIQAAKGYLANYPDIQSTAECGGYHPAPRTRGSETSEDRIPDSLAEATLVCGNVSQCYERLIEMRDSGCAEAILEPYWIEKERIREGIEAAGKIKLWFAQGH